MGTDYGMFFQVEGGTLYSSQSHPLYRDFTLGFYWENKLG